MRVLKSIVMKRMNRMKIDCFTIIRVKKEINGTSERLVNSQKIFLLEC